ncbi:MAG: TM2 domain-containing protein [Bacillota bacterium]|nr:TM2 domain-containing protein [Bacillota bacterium]
MVTVQTQTKFCKYCAEKIPVDAVICTSCGRQVEELKSNNINPNIVIHNNNTNSNVNTFATGKPKNKWLSIILCLLFGWLGAHRFYEGKIVTGIIYFFTMGLMGIGILVDLILLLFKPNPYYV